MYNVAKEKARKIDIFQYNLWRKIVEKITRCMEGIFKRTKVRKVKPTKTQTITSRTVKKASHWKVTPVINTSSYPLAIAKAKTTIKSYHVAIS